MNFYQSRNWNEIKRKALIRDENKCVICGSSKNVLVHHIRPRKNGGSDELGNLETVCKSCHLKEHDEFNKIEYGCTA